MNCTDFLFSLLLPSEVWVKLEWASLLFSPIMRGNWVWQYHTHRYHHIHVLCLEALIGSTKAPVFINARFSRLNGMPLYLIHPSSAWESLFFSITFSSSLRFGVLTSNKPWILYGTTSVLPGCFICLQGDRNWWATGAFSWYIVSRAPSLMSDGIFLFVFSSWLLGSHLLQPWGVCKWRMPLQPWLGWSKLWAGESPVSRPVQRTWHLSPRHGPLQLRSQLDGSRLLRW